MKAVEAYAAKRAIVDLLHARALGADRFDVALMRACHPLDATDNHGTAQGLMHDFIDQLEERARSGPPCRAKQHLVANALVDLESDDAFAESYHVAHEVFEEPRGVTDYERRTPVDPPLMYQGLSDRFHPPHGSVAFRSPADNIDFEAEYGIVTDAVPLGATADAALAHARLLLLIAHAAATRALCAGTVIGSGTVSNRDAAAVGSGCIAEARARPDRRPAADVLSRRRRDRRHRLRHRRPVAVRPDAADRRHGAGRVVPEPRRPRDGHAAAMVGSCGALHCDGQHAGS